MPPLRRTAVIAVAFALLAGLVIGWLDLGATDVQGPLLLLMLAAFVLALVTSAPAWLVGVSVAVGLPLAHLIAGSATWGTLIALVPSMIAAFGGKGIAALMRATSATLAPLAETLDADASSQRGTQRSASPIWPLASALLGCAAAGAVPVYATSVARGQPFAWWLTIIWQIISFLAWVIAVPFVLRSVDSKRVTPAGIASHAAIAAGIALVHAGVLPLVTRALFIPLGPGGITGAATWAFAAYLPLDALTYCLAILLGHASDARFMARAAAARESVIRGELATTQLAILRAQLRPHFLFNALNAATVLARRGDSESSARVLNQLAELLRYVLRGAEEDNDPHTMVRLDEELDFAGSYLAIEQERFPDRLRVAIDASADSRHALVPHLLLQPLVENAVRHGVGAHLGVGTVTIRSWRDANRLHVTVENDRTALAAGTKHGIGLTNTRARLATLYANQAELTLDAREDGAAIAHITVPYVE
ncbi:MAG: histidine kinase [bacterium]